MLIQFLKLAWNQFKSDYITSSLELGLAIIQTEYKKYYDVIKDLNKY